MTLKNAALFALIGMTLLTVMLAVHFIRDVSALLAGAIAAIVLVQPEMERGRSPLVSIPPFGRRFSKHRGLPIRCGLLEEHRREASAPRSSSR